MTSPPVWPTFSQQYENDADPGARFHAFISALFGPEHAGFAAFLSAGKDGAIDCFHADGIVWECKFIGTAGFDAAKARWKEVYKHLNDNLLPAQAKSRQYQPWYNSSTPIQRYCFCTSNTLENEARMAELEALIHADFCILAERDGLAHLKAITVEVWSWDRIGPKLANDPHLRLHWFPDPVPPVFKSLERWMVSYSKGFRAYLTGEVLPYVPLPAAELAPERLLAAFLAGDEPCSVLSGIGGAGKSRLLAETAMAAEKQGWLVYMPGASLSRRDIIDLAQLLGDQPVFIGLDYLEKCDQFEQVLDALREVNAGGKRLYLLATCRHSHWLQIDHLDLVRYSLGNVNLADVVRHILGPDLQQFADECGSVPVFAAFVRFLSATGQQAALQELHNTKDFAGWLVTHILKAGIPANEARPAELDQARLMLMLPATEAALQQLERDAPKLTAWRAGLEADGWLLEAEADTQAGGGLLWQTAHDVIADGTLLRVLREAPNRHVCVVRLLASAQACGAVPTALQTLQRIAQDACLQGFDWLLAFAATKPEWRNHVPAIFSARLLGLAQRVPFLQWYQADMAQLALDPVVQGELGFVTRAVVRAELALDQDQQAALAAWLTAAVQDVGEFNFVLTQALRWRPVQFKAAALIWLSTHPPEYQTHFLLSAWLNAASALGDAAMAQQVGGVLTAWLAQYARWPHASFVTVAWLKAGQDAMPVRDAISTWLLVAKNRIAPEARFIFQTWLDAEQDAGVVKEAIIAWLAVAQNRIAPEAGFIFKAWLDAKQDAGVVKEAIIAWLAVAQNCIAPEAGFIFQSWLDAKQDAGVVKGAIVDWLAVAQNRIAPEAHFIFKAWLDAKQDAGVVKEAIVDWLAVAQNCIAPDAGFIFQSWLDAKQAPELIQTHVLAWLAHGDNAISAGAQFIYRAWGNRFKRLEDTMFTSACLWLQAHRHHEDAAYPMRWIVNNRRLDQATASAIIDWLMTFPTHEDAPNRLCRLHFQALHHHPSDALTKLYAAVLDHYTERAARFGEWDVKTTFFLFFNAVRIAKRPALQAPSRLPLARLFCRMLRKLTPAQIQHVTVILHHLTGGALPGLLRLAQKDGEPFDGVLANHTHWLAQAYAKLGEIGANDAALLRQIGGAKSSGAQNGKPPTSN